MNKRLIAVITLIFFLILAMPVTVFASAESDQALTLSMEDAVSRAVRYSKTLESTKLDTEIAQQNKWDLAGVWHPSFITEYSPVAAAQGLYAAMPALDFRITAAKKTETMKQDMVVAATYKTYYDVLQALDSLQGAEKAYQSAQKQFAIKKLYLEVGMLSNLEFQQALMAFSSSQAALASAQNHVETAYLAFNQQVGLKTEDRPVLTDQPVFTALELNNLDSAIRSIVRNSPSQWLAKEGAKLQERLAHVPGSTEQDAIGAQQADIGADAQYDSTVQAVYGVYYGVKGLEDGYQVAQAGLQLAQKGYDIAKLQLEVGMATQADVLKAEAALAEAQNGLQALIYQHNLMKIAFEKPWCAGSVLGSSSSTSSPPASQK